jgi:hypothetical protein
VSTEGIDRRFSTGFDDEPLAQGCRHKDHHVVGAGIRVLPVLEGLA